MRATIRITSAEFTKFKPLSRIGGRYFTLLIGKSPDGRVKCACVVSKKAARLAITRNTIKRRCREALRAFPTTPSRAHTLVFYAKSNATKASFHEIKEDVVDLLTRLEDIR